MGRQLTDIEFRLFFFAAVFLIMFTSLTVICSPIFTKSEYYQEENPYLQDIPPEFSAVDFYQFAANGYVWFNSYNATSPNQDFTIGGWKVRVKFPTGSVNRTYAYTYETWWIFEWGWKNLIWTTTKGIRVSYNELGTGTEYFDIAAVDKYYDVKKDYSEFQLKRDDARLKVYVSYDRTAYTSALAAHQANALKWLYGCELDAVKTSMNIFEILGMLLGGGLSIPFPFNLFFLLPFIISIIIVTYALIIKLFPF